MRVVVGRIGRPHGIGGELAVEPRTDEPERRFASGTSVLCRHGSLTVDASRPHAGKLLVKFVQVPDRTAAEIHRGCELEVEVDPDASPEDGGFYDHQLRGLQVIVDGVISGTVVDVLHLPGHDSLEIEIENRRVQVPFVEDLVPEVDITAGFLRVIDRPGLLDPAEADEVR